MAAIVQRWAQKSPATAASWVSQLTDTPCRDAAVQNLVALWVTQDSAAADNRVRGLPSGSLRDVAVTAYDRALAERAGASGQVLN